MYDCQSFIAGCARQRIFYYSDKITKNVRHGKIYFFAGTENNNRYKTLGVDFGF